MFPSSPQRDPFYRDPGPPPDPTEQGTNMGCAATVVVGALWPTLGLIFGPFPTALMLHPTFRETLVEAPTGGRGMSEITRRNTIEGFALISSFPAFYWAVAMLVGLACLFHPHTRIIGRLGLLAGALILLATAARYALFALAHR